MADHTKIEWTDATWNPVTGCSVVSPGCTHCYAMKLAGTRLAHHPSRAGLTRETKAGPVWNGTVRLNEAWLTQPLGWKLPRMVFVCAHGDLFHEDVPDAWIDRVFAVMALAPQHTFQVLTKRAVRMRDYLGTRAGDWWAHWPNAARCAGALLGDMPAVGRAMPWPLPNVWLGISAEDQARADERLPDLLETPAAVRFVSAEPLLGPIDFQRIAMPQIRYETGIHYQDVLRAGSWSHKPFFRPAQPGEEQVFFTNHSDTNRLDWIIVGGENGPRPMQAEWALAIRDQCAAAGTPFFFKQWGSHIPAGQTKANGKVWAPGCGTRLRATKAITGRLLDGVEHNGMPRAAR